MSQTMFIIPASLHACNCFLKLNSQVCFSEKRRSFGPIFCLFLTSLWCVQSTPPHNSSAGKSASLQLCHKQSGLITGYTLLHLPGLSAACTCACVCLLVDVFSSCSVGVYDDFVCAQWVASTLRWIAVRVRHFEALTWWMSSVIRQVVDVPKACDLAKSGATVKSREVLLSAWYLNTAHSTNYHPVRHKHVRRIATLCVWLFEGHDDHNQPCVGERAIPWIECNRRGELRASCSLCKQITGWQSWDPLRVPQHGCRYVVCKTSMSLMNYT